MSSKIIELTELDVEIQIDGPGATDTVDTDVPLAIDVDHDRADTHREAAEILTAIYGATLGLELAHDSEDPSAVLTQADVDALEAAVAAGERLLDVLQDDGGPENMNITSSVTTITEEELDEGALNTDEPATLRRQEIVGRLGDTHDVVDAYALAPTDDTRDRSP